MTVAELADNRLAVNLAGPAVEDDPEVGHGAQQDTDASKDVDADDDAGPEEEAGD